MGMASNTVTVSSTTSGLWAFDSTTNITSTGGFSWNRPPAKIPRGLKRLLTDPKVIFLDAGLVWLSQARRDGYLVEKYSHRVSTIGTVGVASNIETGEVEYWVSFLHDDAAYQVFPGDNWKIFTSTPPAAFVRDAARKYRERHRPTMTTTSYSASW